MRLRIASSDEGRHRPGPRRATVAGVCLLLMASSSRALPPAVTSQPAPLVLRDWPAEPLIDPSEVRAPELRVVSLAPSATEIVCALGLADRLVARTPYCVHPPAVRGVPTIGGLVDLDIERLVALRPDRILLAGNSRAQAGKLRAAGLSYTRLPDQTLADVFESIRIAGRVLGRPRTAEQLCRAIRGELGRVRARYRHLPRRRVLIVLGELSDPPRPPFAAGQGSLYDDLLRLAGQQNAAPASRRAFAPLSLEAIARCDPEVIVQLAPDASRTVPARQVLGRWARVGPLRAVREGRIYTLAGEVYYVPGPRVSVVLRDLCRVIAGEAP